MYQILLVGISLSLLVIIPFLYLTRIKRTNVILLHALIIYWIYKVRGLGYLPLIISTTHSYAAIAWFTRFLHRRMKRDYIIISILFIGFLLPTLVIITGIDLYLISRPNSPSFWLFNFMSSMFIRLIPIFEGANLSASAIHTVESLFSYLLFSMRSEILFLILSVNLFLSLQTYHFLVIPNSQIQGSGSRVQGQGSKIRHPVSGIQHQNSELPNKLKVYPVRDFSNGAQSSKLKAHSRIIPLIYMLSWFLTNYMNAGCMFFYVRKIFEIIIILYGITFILSLYEAIKKTKTRPSIFMPYVLVFISTLYPLKISFLVIGTMDMILDMRGFLGKVVNKGKKEAFLKAPSSISTWL